MLKEEFNRAGELQHLLLRYTQAYVHFHCCVIDGVFATGEDGQVHFTEAGALTPEDLAAVQQQVRARVLRWFARAGHLDRGDARDMAGWNHGGGFSLDASVRIEGPDRSGLERLLRYCARPPFALERLEQLGDDQLVYRFPKPQPDGRTELRLSPLELIERLAVLIPSRRLKRHGGAIDPWIAALARSCLALHLQRASAFAVSECQLSGAEL